MIHIKPVSISSLAELKDMPVNFYHAIIDTNNHLTYLIKGRELI